MARMRRLRAGIAPNDSAARFAGLGIDVFLGEARFIGPDTIDVGGERLQFARAILATGARAAALPVPGLADAGYLTNETVFSLTERPARLVVIGAGPIGCEMAQAFARLGIARHRRESRCGRCFPGRTPTRGASSRRCSSARGSTLRLGATLTRASRTGGGRQLTIQRDGRDETLEADEILVAVGRTPNVEGLGLEHAGVAATRAGVTVDDFLRTSNPRIYAAGDICTPYKFTHAADAMARIAIQNALFFGRKRASTLVIPWATYTDPEIAHVGLSATDAAEGRRPRRHPAGPTRRRGPCRARRGDGGLRARPRGRRGPVGSSARRSCRVTRATSSASCRS